LHLGPEDGSCARTRTSGSTVTDGHSWIRGDPSGFFSLASLQHSCVRACQLKSIPKVLFSFSNFLDFYVNVDSPQCHQTRALTGEMSSMNWRRKMRVAPTKTAKANASSLGNDGRRGPRYASVAHGKSCPTKRRFRVTNKLCIAGSPHSDDFVPQKDWDALFDNALVVLGATSWHANEQDMAQPNIILNPSCAIPSNCESLDHLVPQTYWDDLFENALELLGLPSPDRSESN
jgi:hypothetical protein